MKITEINIIGKVLDDDKVFILPRKGVGFTIQFFIIRYYTLKRSKLKCKSKLTNVFNDLRREVIVRFVDIGGIVDHHCLMFLLISDG